MHRLQRKRPQNQQIQRPLQQIRVAAIFPSTFDNRVLLFLSNVKGRTKGNSTPWCSPLHTEIRRTNSKC
jgi:hypothetical protein